MRRLWLNGRVFLGIEIGGTKLQMVLGDENGRIHRRERRAVNPSLGGAGIREQIQEGIPKLFGNGKILAAGIGFGGPVDWRSGRICRSYQIEGWSDFELGPWLQEKLRLPVRMDNDANVACLGEALLGAGRQKNPVFYVTLGSGVGGGLVVDGAIYHGALPGESEIGHIRLDRSGTIVENRCSGWAVDQRIREAIASAPSSVLAKICAGSSGGEARHLSEALRQGDVIADQILTETAEHLAFALSHVVHLCHPEAIVLGGGLSLVGAPLQERVSNALRTFTMSAFAPGPSVHLAGLGEDSVPCGALLLAAAEAKKGGQ